MHRDPHLAIKAECLPQHRPQFRKAPGDVVLATADTDARLQRRELGQIAVAAETEIVARHRPRQLAEAAKRQIVPVKANQTMVLELRDLFRKAVFLHVTSMRIKSDRALADAAGDERFLPRPKHAAGKVRVPPPQ